MSKWGLAPNDKCYFCRESVETLSHMLYLCEVVKELWTQVYDYITERFKVKDLDVSVKAVIKKSTCKEER